MRQFIKNNAKLHSSFQSTHSLRSATMARITVSEQFAVSIHALLAECDAINGGGKVVHVVSIHALLAECDHIPPLSIPPEKLFQSTHSLRSATGNISRCASLLWGFNPRTPCGVRPIIAHPIKPAQVFQSTHSLRSATMNPMLPGFEIK